MPHNLSLKHGNDYSAFSALSTRVLLKPTAHVSIPQRSKWRNCQRRLVYEKLYIIRTEACARLDRSESCLHLPVEKWLEMGAFEAECMHAATQANVRKNETHGLRNWRNLKSWTKTPGGKIKRSRKVPKLLEAVDRAVPQSLTRKVANC